MATMASTWMKPPETIARADAAPADSQSEMLALFSAHGPALYRFCRGTLGQSSDAEDIVQDTFLKLLQHLESAGDRSNLRAWLFAVAANACRDRARSRMRWLPWRAELDHRTTGSIDDDEPDRRRARAALRALSPRDRMLLSLRAEGLSYRQMANAAGIAEQSVGRLLARAVARWRNRHQALGIRQQAREQLIKGPS
jgi:RNA polymerase sigma-70 factor, ECF subfamily